MKLYTKEMFLYAAAKCEVCVTDIEHIIKYIDEYVDAIEFPSNNDIPKKASSRFDGFIKGAKYVKRLNKLK